MFDEILIAAQPDRRHRHSLGQGLIFGFGEKKQNHQTGKKQERQQGDRPLEFDN